MHTSLIRESTSKFEHYFTKSSFYIKLIRGGLSELFREKNLETISPTKLWDELDYRSVLDKYILWLTKTKGYKPENIIVIENRMVHYYTDGNSLLPLDVDPYIDIYQRNALLQEMYNYFESKCAGCHAIKMPCNVYADKHHVWGLSDLHYYFEFYEYAAKGLRIITDGVGDTKRKLMSLYDHYTDIFMQKTYELMRNSFAYTCNKNYLGGYLHKSMNDGYFAPKGTPYFESITDRKEKGILSKSLKVIPYGMHYAKAIVNNETYYFNKNQCCAGYIGTHKLIGNYWYTQNTNTEVRLTEDSAIISHSGESSLAQTQVIQVIKNNENLAGKPVVLSVYARVLRKNSDGKGGIIAIINENGYNKGNLFVFRKFENMEWKRIVCSAYLPDENKFKGVTVCLRALTSKDSFDGAVVEFKHPKLEIGGYPTSVI